MTQEQINELRKLAQAATPGPWYLRTNRHRNTDGSFWGWLDTQQAGDQLPPPGVNVTWSDGRQSERNADFISAANPAAILALIQQRDELLAALELFMERVDEPPEANCSCHISPPCNDCVENWGLREAFSDAKAAISKAEAKS